MSDEPASVSLALKLKPVPVAHDSVASTAELAWPHMVPSTDVATAMLLEPDRLPPSLAPATQELIKVFGEREVLAAPKGIELEAWQKAQAVIWRLKMAAALAQDALNHDEVALQQMFEEAARVRTWLLELANRDGFEGQLQAQALRGLLQAAWDDVLEHAPVAPADAPQRPQSHTGNSGLNKIPTPPKPKPAAKAKNQFEGNDQPIKFGRYFLIAALLALAALRLLFVDGDLEAAAQVIPDGEAVAPVTPTETP